MSDPRHAGTYQVWIARYEFTDPGGHKRTGTCQHLEDPAKGTLGEVMYDPERPTRNQAVSRQNGPLGTDLIVLTFASVVVALYAVPLFMMGLGYQ